MPESSYLKTWISHSKIADFLKCRRAFYLRSVYKNPKTGRRMTVMAPALALGQAVHEIIESLAVLPVEDRLKISLVKKLDTAWLKVTGKKGGFKSYSEESAYRERATQMLMNLQEDPGPILKKAIKIKTDEGFDLPHYDLSVKDGIILAGKIDWLSYNEENDSVHIIDFKTGKHEEREGSLQLPIYLLLATNTQSKKVDGASYWYLDRDDGIIEKKLPDMNESYKEILDISLIMKSAIARGDLKCVHGGCNHCRPLERVLAGEGELVGTSDMNQDIYFLSD